MTKYDSPPYFPLYVDDFTSDGNVEAMTTEEVGAYILLLCKAWREDLPGTLPTNDRVLARWARLSPDRWEVCKPAILAAFKVGPDNRYHQRRMRREFEKFQKQKRLRSQSAQNAANARWNGHAKVPENEGGECESHADRNADAMRKNAIQRQTSTSDSDVSTRASSGSSTSSGMDNRARGNGRKDVDALRDFLGEEETAEAASRFRNALKVVTPSKEKDQRALDLDLIAKAAIRSITTYSQDWFEDSVRSVAENEVRGPKPGYFHRTLQSKLKMNDRAFGRMLATTIVPDGFIEAAE